MAKTTGGLGGKADSTLVQSAFMLGRSAVPGDWSNIFNKQYEGLIAAHKARAEAYGDALETIAESTGDVLETIVEQKEERKETRETKFDEIQEQIDAGINDLVQTHTKKTIGNKKNVQHYQQGGGMPKWNSDAYQNRLEKYKSELEVLDNKTFRNKKDREKRAEIYRKLDQLKKNMINEKGTWRTTVDAHANDFVNLDLSYKDNKDRQMLLSQYLKYNSNYEDQEIEVWLDDNDKKMITYTAGRLRKQYEENLRQAIRYGTEEDIAGIKKQIAELGDAPSKSITISEEELFAGVQYKDAATETALTGLTATSIDNAAEYLDKKSGTYVVTNYDELSINNIAKTKEILGKADVNLLDLATRDMENIPGQTEPKNFAKDLDKYISNASYEEFGIDISAVEAADTDGDGRISNEEYEATLRKAEEDGDKIDPKFKKKLIETILGNEDMLKNELANWWDHINRDRFNARRAKLDNITTNNNNNNNTTPLIKLPWGEFSRRKDQEKNLTTVMAIANNQKTIKVGNVTWELQDNGDYMAIRQYTGQKLENIDKATAPRLTKTTMIQEYGGMYSGIPNDYDWGDKGDNTWKEIAARGYTPMANLGQSEMGKTNVLGKGLEQQ